MRTIKFAWKMTEHGIREKLGGEREMYTIVTDYKGSSVKTADESADCARSFCRAAFCRAFCCVGGRKMFWRLPPGLDSESEMDSIHVSRLTTQKRVSVCVGRAQKGAGFLWLCSVQGRHTVSRQIWNFCLLFTKALKEGMRELVTHDYNSVFTVKSYRNKVLR
jgi:hypothetical protein